MKLTDHHATLARMLMLVAHDDQTDLAGAPYYLHPQAVGYAAFSDADRVIRGATQSELEEAIVGYLHDVLEDTYVCYPTLKNLFGSTIAEAVMMVTRLPGDTYESFITLIATHGGRVGELARIVKLRDLEHNLSRIEKVADEAKRERLSERYEAAHRCLTAIVELNGETAP